MKRTFTLVTCLMLIALLLAGCSGGGTKSAKASKQSITTDLDLSNVEFQKTFNNYVDRDTYYDIQTFMTQEVMGGTKNMAALTGEVSVMAVCNEGDGMVNTIGVVVNDVKTVEGAFPHYAVAAVSSANNNNSQAEVNKIVKELGLEDENNYMKDYTKEYAFKKVSYRFKSTSSGACSLTIKPVEAE